MDASLAIYEALIQASVPPPAARRVAECLEKDVSSNLATKSDLMLVQQQLEHLGQTMATNFAALDARFEAIDTRFEAMESRFTLMNQNLESRLVFKLGALMVVLFGLAGTMLKLLS